jgi:hypothetical protein
MNGVKETPPMRALSIFVVLSLAPGCAKQGASQTAAAIPDAHTTPAAAASNAAPAASPQFRFQTISGTVLETLDASDYTYLRLKTENGETWAAVTRARIAKGQKVTVVNAMPMDGFESKTLKRTFDRLVFGNLATPGDTAPAAAGAASPMPPMAMGHEPAGGAAPSVGKEQMAMQHGQAASGPADAPDVKVPKAEGPGARTVAELWAQRATLKGKDVVVQAKVVKVTAGVMGKNWLHLRDGSGSKATKDNDLTVTTDATANMGDVVIVNGIVSVDKDFGSGYAYPVILENARMK